MVRCMQYLALTPASPFLCARYYTVCVMCPLEKPPLWALQSNAYPAQHAIVGTEALQALCRSRVAQITRYTCFSQLWAQLQDHKIANLSAFDAHAGMPQGLPKTA